MERLFLRLLALAGPLVALICGACGESTSKPSPKTRWSGEDSGYESTTNRPPPGKAPPKQNPDHRPK